jgi:hypothetical protein
MLIERKILYIFLNVSFGLSDMLLIAHTVVNKKSSNLLFKPNQLYNIHITQNLQVSKTAVLINRCDKKGLS